MAVPTNRTRHRSRSRSRRRPWSSSTSATRDGRTTGSSRAGSSSAQGAHGGPVDVVRRGRGWGAQTGGQSFDEVPCEASCEGAFRSCGCLRWGVVPRRGVGSRVGAQRPASGAPHRALEPAARCGLGCGSLWVEWGSGLPMCAVCRRKALGRLRGQKYAVERSSAWGSDWSLEPRAVLALGLRVGRALGLRAVLALGPRAVLALGTRAVLAWVRAWATHGVRAWARAWERPSESAWSASSEPRAALT